MTSESNLPIQVFGDYAVINGRRLRAFAHDPPFKDGSTCSVEATSVVTNQYEQKLLPSELAGISGAQIPLGFSVQIYRPTSQYEPVDFLSIENLRYGPRLRISVDYSFKDWRFRSNLIHFAEELRGRIEAAMPQCTAVTRKEDYGVSIDCWIKLGPTTDSFALFTEAVTTAAEQYAVAVKGEDPSFVKKLNVEANTADAGWKWWIQYVVVPILSGSAGAAVIAWLLTRQ